MDERFYRRRRRAGGRGEDARVRPVPQNAARDALMDAHDALGEMLSLAQRDWPDLAAYTGNDAWIGLKQRIDDALG